MRILLTGSKGQLGRALLAYAPSRENLDLSDENSCKAIIKGSISPYKMLFREEFG